MTGTNIPRFHVILFSQDGTQELILQKQIARKNSLRIDFLSGMRLHDWKNSLGIYLEMILARMVCMYVYRCMYVCMCIYIYAVKLLSGPSLAISGVIIWAK